MAARRRADRRGARTLALRLVTLSACHGTRRDHVENLGEAVFEIGHLAAVLDDVRGPPGLLLLGQLAGVALVDRGVAARAGALGPALLRRDHGDRGVEQAVHV